MALYGEDVGRAQYRAGVLLRLGGRLLGAFYAREMAQVRNEGRIDEIEALPDQYVHRAWDLGVTDDTSIWWFQVVGAQLFILDHYAASGVGVERFAERDRASARRQYGWRTAPTLCRTMPR